MEKILLLSHFALGDCAACTVALAKNLSKTSQVFCVTSTQLQYRYLREMPYFHSVIQSENHRPDKQLYPDVTSNEFIDLHTEKYTDLAKIFILYDKVYITRLSFYKQIHKYVDSKLLTNVVAPTTEKHIGQYRPLIYVGYFGFTEFDFSVDINWYSRYYFDFKCGNNTVLVNGLSDSTLRSYKRTSEVIDLLKSLNFDVRVFDIKTDIRKNLHLINQAKYILTTDTSTLWLAKALHKTPFVFMSNNEYPNETIQKLLGTKNIVPCRDIDEIEPEEIVQGFLRSIKRQSLME